LFKLEGMLQSKNGGWAQLCCLGEMLLKTQVPPCSKWTVRKKNQNDVFSFNHLEWQKQVQFTNVSSIVSIYF
jgi:hypothetical protein